MGIDAAEDTSIPALMVSQPIDNRQLTSRASSEHLAFVLLSALCIMLL